VGKYLLRRLLQMIPVFLFATFLIYAMVFLMPGDPIRALFGERSPSASSIAAIRDRYNLDDPFFVQYVKYMLGVLTGDFGTDFRGRAVTDIMTQKIPITVRLAIVAFTMEVLIGIIAGILAAVRKGRFIDNLVLVSTISVISIPIFVIGYMAQLGLAVEMGWFPVAGVTEGFRSYLLPGFVLGSVSLAYVARLTRTSLVENLRADYVRTATSKGMLRRRVIGVHALRNSMIPVVTFLAFDIGSLISGAIITETVFNIPGIGRAVFDAVLQQEGSVVVGLITFLVTVYVVSNLLVDLLYGVLDPRIRYE